MLAQRVSALHCIALQVQLQPGAPVSAAAALRAQLCTDDAPACFGNLQRLPCLLGFALWPEYRTSLLEGTLTSIGGISTTLSERCTGALACLLCQPAFMASHVAKSSNAKQAGVTALAPGGCDCKAAELALSFRLSAVRNQATTAFWDLCIPIANACSKPVYGTVPI